ncbi:MAG: pentapeptide repeat-containing protein, partial [Desulfobacteraceae bacterium]
MRKRSILTFILLAFIFGASIIYIPKWQLHDRGIENAKERIMLENQLRGSLAQILGWTLVLIGLYFVMRRMTAAERTAELSKQAQVSERFTRAINQLAASYTNGKKRLEIRVGGIYGLEGIARESSEYYWPVMEILTAYVRENASWEEKIQDPSERLKVVGKESKTDPLYTLYPKLPADIQALLTVIGRRGLSYLNGEDHRINLTQTNLRGATLMGANLRGALLLRTNLQKARFTKSNLS